MLNKLSLFNRMRFMVYVMGKIKIPMIGYVSPSILELNDEKATVKIKLKRRTKNHLNSMYFGALAVGADLVGGIHAFYYAEKTKSKISFAFKDLKADFLMRAESHVLFTTNDGLIIQEAMNKAITENTRINQPVTVTAFNTSGEKVAIFVVTASFKPI